MKLTDRFEKDVIIFKGKHINLTLSFDIVLKAFELLEDKDFDDAEKWAILALMFTENEKDIQGMNGDEITTFVNAVFDNFINDPPEEGESAASDQPASKKQPVMDFVQDAEYIYAAFLLDYNIDLFEHQGKMHWRKFKALLNGLSDHSMFSKIVEIRAREMPKPTKDNKEERDNLRKLKRKFALKAEIEAMDAQASMFAAKLRPERGG